MHKRAKLAIGIILLVIVVGGIVIYHQATQLIAMNKTIKEEAEIKSETSFVLEKDSEVKFKYNITAKEGSLNVVLKDGQNRKIDLFTTNEKGTEVIPLSEGTYKVQVYSNDFIGTYHIKAYKA